MGLFDRALLTSAWRLYSSEDKTGSLLLLSGGVGSLYAENTEDGEKMKINFKYFGGGVSKGGAANFEWSKTTDPSDGVGSIVVTKGSYFGSLMFPIRGFMYQLGASAGIAPRLLGVSDQSSVALTIIQFGLPPFTKAFGKMWGTGNTILATAGFSMYLVTFELG